MLGPSLRRSLGSPDKVFLLVGFLLGILFVFVTPPFQVPDELAHFYRAYDVSEGGIVAVKRDDGAIGDLLPTSVITTARLLIRDIPFHPTRREPVSYIISKLNIALDAQNKTFAVFQTTAIYSPVPYIPQALGIAIGRSLNLSTLILFYLGRIVNLLIALSITYWAIKTTPILGWCFLLLSLTPMAVSQRSSLSADALTNALAILLIAMVARYAFGKDQDSSRIEKSDFSQKSDFYPKGMLVLVTLAALLSLCKPGYFIFSALLVVIPASKLGTPKKRWIFVLGTVCICVLVTFVWLLVARDIYMAPLDQSGSLPPIPHPDVSALGQVQFILSNPLKYVEIFATNFSHYGGDYLAQFIGVLGWLDTDLPQWLRLSFGVALIFAMLAGGVQEIAIGFWSKAMIATVVAANVALTCTAAYLTFPVGSVPTLLMQGRYLIPAAPLVALLFYNRRLIVNLSGGILAVLITGYVTFALLSTLVVLVNRYYVPLETLTPASSDGIAVGEILPGKPVVQSFECPVQTLRDVEIPFDTFARQNTSQLSIRLSDENNVEMISQTISTSVIKDKEWRAITLPKPVLNCFGTSLKLEIDSVDGTPGNAVTTLAFPRYYRGKLLSPATSELATRSLGLGLNTIPEADPSNP